MSLRTRTYGYLAALAATVVWSGNFVVARGAAHAIGPVELNFWRWLVALACMLPLALPKLRADWPGIRSHWRYLAVMALVGISGLNAFIYKAGQTTESLNMALLVPTAPVMIIILSRVVYGEPITPRRLTGLAVVLAGVLVLISRGDWRHVASVQFTAGDLWSLAGAACFAVYSFLVRQRPLNISVEGFNAATFAMGLALLLPALGWEMASLPAATLNAPVLAGILYAGVGCSFVSYLLWTKAISAIGPVRAGLVYYSLPVFAALASSVVLGETIRASHLIGGGLIIAGILIATVDLRPAQGLPGK